MSCWNSTAGTQWKTLPVYNIYEKVVVLTQKMEIIAL